MYADWMKQRCPALTPHDWQNGPFALAWLETILRAADIRASREANA